MLSRFVVLILFIGMVCAATWQGYVPKKPEEFKDKEGCYVKEINDVIPHGTDISPIGYCYRISCGKAMMYYASCGVVGTDDPNCHITEMDLTKPYPACCRGVKCDSDNAVL